MIFVTVGDTLVQQCDQVELRVHTGDCCDGTTPPSCDIPGFPPFRDFGFRADSTELGNALSFEEIQRQIGCLRAPICTKWRNLEADGRPAGTNHFVIVVAYKIENGEQWVEVFNPRPVFRGSPMTITYSQFIQSAEWAHGKDYYNIKKED